MTTGTVTWRPQVLWFPMGGLLGALAGAVTGVAIVLLVPVIALVGPGSPELILGDLVWGVLVAIVFGGMGGAVVGLFVGVELMFLVGAHLPRDVARRRAFRLGFVLPPATMLVPALLTGSIDLFRWDGEEIWALMLMTGACVLGGPLARWLAGFQPPRPPVET
jgi:hypothetical protein